MSALSNRIVVYAMMLSLTLTCLIYSSAARGQKGSAQYLNPGYSGARSQPVDDTTLKQTARAYVKVREIVQTGQQALDGTRDNTEKQQIAEQVESRKLAAVKSEGLQPQQYNQVIQLVQADAHLRQKFLSYADRVKSGAE
jgi:hypothetical protein